MALKAKDKPDLSGFDWKDPFLLEGQLDEDERMLRDAAAAFAADRLQPRIRGAYSGEKVEPEIFGEMGQAGLLGMTVPAVSQHLKKLKDAGIVTTKKSGQTIFYSVEEQSQRIISSVLDLFKLPNSIPAL